MNWWEIMRKWSDSDFMEIWGFFNSIGYGKIEKIISALKHILYKTPTYTSLLWTCEFWRSRCASRLRLAVNNISQLVLQMYALRIHYIHFISSPFNRLCILIRTCIPLVGWNLIHTSYRTYSLKYSRHTHLYYSTSIIFMFPSRALSSSGFPRLNLPTFGIR